jgi:hypothetical protein
MAFLRTGDPRVRAVTRWVVIGGAMTSAVGFFFSMLEMGSVMDGSGMGLFGFGHTTGAFPVMWLGGAASYLTAALMCRDGRLAAKALGGGFALFLGLMVSGLGQSVFAMVWTPGCLERNDAHLCYAAGAIQQHTFGFTRAKHEKARVLYLRGCALQGQRWRDNCCRRLLEDATLSPADRAKACQELRSALAAEAAKACRRLPEVCEGNRGGGDRCQWVQEACANTGASELARLGCPP